MDDLVRVMSYNIRSSSQDDGIDGWERRKNRVADVVRVHRPDLIGLQEARHDQLTDLGDRLEAYEYAGVGRLDGDTEGEYCAIGYRPDRYELIDHDTFWLSETPEEPGSVGWDASHSRIVTYALFQDRSTGERYHHFNTHLDHNGETARLESVRMLRSAIDDVAEGVPTVVTGDFNFRTDTDPYHLVTDAEEANRSLRDAYHASRLGHHGPSTTWNDFDAPKPGMKIDYIFVTEEWDVLSHGAYEHVYDDGRYPSDHLPIQATLRLRSNDGS